MFDRTEGGKNLSFVSFFAARERAAKQHLTAVGLRAHAVNARPDPRAPRSERIANRMCAAKRGNGAPIGYGDRISERIVRQIGGMQVEKLAKTRDERGVEQMHPSEQYDALGLEALDRTQEARIVGRARLGLTLPHFAFNMSHADGRRTLRGNGIAPIHHHRSDVDR